MRVSRLFIVTAVVELSAGALFALAPELQIRLLFGWLPLTEAADLAARFAGVALMAIAAMCWLARRDEHSGAAQAIITGLTIYNVAAMLLLLAAAIGARLMGVLLWPAVLVHAVLAVWCVGARRRARTAATLSSYRRRAAVR